MNTRQFIESEGLYGLTPRTRCISCRGTIAQILQSYNRYAILDGQYLDKGGDHYTAIKREGWICYPCLEMEEIEPNSVLAVHDNGCKYSFRIGHYAIIEVGEDEISGNLFEEIVRPFAQKLVWRPTDAWRGAYIGKFNTAFAKVLDDWFGIDGHNCDRGDLGKFHQKYQVDGGLPDCTLAVAFPRTSNICACGIEVYVRNSDLPRFREWLGVSELETENN